jgi:hypothetical protein
MASTKMDAMQVNTTQAAVLMYEIGVRAGELAASCSGGTNECALAELATAAPSSPSSDLSPSPDLSRGYDLSRVYDHVASEATRKINLILKEAAKSRKDEDLMLCNVGDGQMMLLWGTRGLPKGFTPVNNIKEIRRLLGVKEVKNAESWPGAQENH